MCLTSIKEWETQSSTCGSWRPDPKRQCFLSVSTLSRGEAVDVVGVSGELPSNDVCSQGGLCMLSLPVWLPGPVVFLARGSLGLVLCSFQGVSVWGSLSRGSLSGTVSIHRGISVRETPLDRDPPPHVEERTVRILLECCLVFMQFSGKIMKNNRIAPRELVTPLEIPGSTTDLVHDICSFCYSQYRLQQRRVVCACSGRPRNSQPESQRQGGANQLFGQFFPKNCKKNRKKIGPRGARVSVQNLSV